MVHNKQVQLDRADSARQKEKEAEEERIRLQEEEEARRRAELAEAKMREEAERKKAQLAEMERQAKAAEDVDALLMDAYHAARLVRWCVCVCACVCVCLCVCVCVCVFCACVHACVHTRMHVCVFTSAYELLINPFSSMKTCWPGFCCLVEVSISEKCLLQIVHQHILS